MEDWIGFGISREQTRAAILDMLQGTHQPIMSSCMADHTSDVNKWVRSMHYISVWAMMQHVSSGSGYFIQPFTRCKARLCKTLISFFSTLQASKVDRGGGRVNGETKSCIAAAARHDTTLTTPVKRVKAGARETELVWWVSQDIMHAFTTPNEGVVSQSRAVTSVWAKHGGKL